MTASSGQVDSSGDEGDDTSGPSSAGTEDESEGSSDSGAEYSCEFELGCHTPKSPNASAGVTSDVPIGCGGGDFTLRQTISVASFADPEAPRSVPLLGDLDGDANLDLLVNFRKASAGWVFPGLGDGTVGGQPAALTGGLFAGGWGGDLGDFDGDGRLDVLLGDHTRSARAWRSAGGMVFDEARQGLPDNVWFSGAGLADLNGDGSLDALFGADQFASGVHLYWGSGGTWTSATGPTIAGSNLGYFVFADYDNDGDLDIFVFGKGGVGGVTVFVHRNDGASFASVAQLDGGTPGGGADPVQGSVGDVDCDGDLDIAAGGTIHLFDGAAWSPAATVDATIISHLGDLTGDGHLDLVTQGPSVGLAVYAGDGTGQGWTLQDAGLPDASSGLTDAYGIELGDLDGNDSLDIVRIAGYSGQYSVEIWTR